MNLFFPANCVWKVWPWARAVNFSEYEFFDFSWQRKELIEFWSMQSILADDISIRPYFFTIREFN